jgi:hypothetical protein
MQITVTYELSLQELQRSQRQKSSMSRRVLIPGLALLCGALGILAGTRDPVMDFFAAYCFFIFVLALIAPGWWIAKTGAKQCVLTEATFTPETFGARTAFGSSVYRWEFLDRTGEGKDFFFLYVTRYAVVAVPKRAFTPEQLAGMRYLLAVAPVDGKPGAGAPPAPMPLAGV